MCFDEARRIKWPARWPDDCGRSARSSRNVQSLGFQNFALFLYRPGGYFSKFVLSSSCIDVHYYVMNNVWNKKNNNNNNRKRFWPVIH